MDGLIAETRGNLCEIQSPFPDQTAGRLNFQTAEIFHDAAARLRVEKLLQLAAADQIVTADLFHRQSVFHMLFQISCYPRDGFILGAGGQRLDGRMIAMADQTDQQLLERGTDQLFAAEGRSIRVV